MSIQASCQKCGKTISVSDELVLQTVLCPKCKNPILIQFDSIDVCGSEENVANKGFFIAKQTFQRELLTK